MSLPNSLRTVRSGSATWMVALLGLAPVQMTSAAVITTPYFTNGYAPGNWEVPQSPPLNPVGSQILWGGGDGVNLATTLTIIGPQASGPAFTSIGLKSPYATVSGLLSFTWNLVQLGNSGMPTAYLYIGEGANLETHTFSTANGSRSQIWVDAGDKVEFELNSEWIGGGGKGPAQFVVSDFNLTVIPEAEAWWSAALLGLLALGETWRRSRRRVAAR